MAGVSVRPDGCRVACVPGGMNMKTVLVTGASGLVGGALTQGLQADGHRVVPLPRFGGEVPAGVAGWNPAAGVCVLPADLNPQVVIHLAGENAGSLRWTAAKKRRIVQSRVDGARTLVAALLARPQPPELVLMASAVGWYGDTGDRPADEEDGPGEGFLADVCRQVEPLAAPLTQAGVRVVQARFGVVLSPRGGALQRLLPSFRLGLGGPVGSGRQWFSWVALPELVQMVRFAMHTPALAGPVNFVAPGAVPYRDFAAALGRAVHRPARLPLPAPVVRALFGEMGEQMLLASSRVVPGRLSQAGYRFCHPTINAALAAVLGER